MLDIWGSTVAGNGVLLRSNVCYFSGKLVNFERDEELTPQFKVCIALWIRIVLLLGQNRSSSFSEQYWTVLARHLVMTAIFFTLFVAMFSHRLYNAISGTDIFVLMELHVIALGGIGTWLFFCFALSKHNYVLCRNLLLSGRLGYSPLGGHSLQSATDEEKAPLNQSR